MSGGRPTVMTPEVKAELLARVADGESVRQICDSAHMPSRSVVYLAMANDRDFSDHYARAREAQIERWADEIVEISDDGTNDWIERENKDGSKFDAIDHEHISRSRLRVDTRKWIMSKLLPKKYGDRLIAEHSGKDGGPIQTEDVSNLDLARRIAFILERGSRDKP